MAAISGEPLRLRAWHRPFDYETATGRIGSTPGEGNSRPIPDGERPSTSCSEADIPKPMDLSR
jgi:hypothetical protein